MMDHDCYLYLYELYLYGGYWGHGHALTGASGGSCLWQFDGKEWKLMKDVCAAGYQPGKPPREPGTFAGEIRKTRAVLQNTNASGHTGAGEHE